MRHAYEMFKHAKELFLLHSQNGNANVNAQPDVQSQTEKTGWWKETKLSFTTYCVSHPTALLNRGYLYLD